MSDDRNRLDVPRPIPNRSERRRVRVGDWSLPTLDDARAAATLARAEARTLVRSRALAAAVAGLEPWAAGDAE